MVLDMKPPCIVRSPDQEMSFVHICVDMSLFNAFNINSRCIVKSGNIVLVIEATVA